MLLMPLGFILVLGNSFSPTSAILDLNGIMIRQDDSSVESIRLDDPTIWYDSLLPAANDPERSPNIFGTTDSVADQYDLDRSSAHDEEASLGFLPDLLIPQSGYLLAFHDGDLPPEGWGDCEFPKMPACCEYGLSRIFCVWYSNTEDLCPEHPDAYDYPRGPNEQDKYRPVCCDQIKDGTGVGCVPVTGREEEVGLDSDWPAEDEWYDDIWSPGYFLRDFNNLQFNPVPSTCKSAYRRDEQIESPCLFFE